MQKVGGKKLTATIKRGMGMKISRAVTTEVF